MVLPVIKQITLTFFSEILNLEGHSNCIAGSKVTVILLNEWILSVGGASSEKGLRAACKTGLSLLLTQLVNFVDIMVSICFF